MSATPSTMLELGTRAPDFNLPNVYSGNVSLDQVEDEILVVMFICNHCPYVLHIEDELVKLTKEYKSKGVEFIAISSNDIDKYPQDSPEKMEEKNYPFPYLFDEEQEVAKAYKAACTPDFFVFNKNKELVYRGQFDESRPKKPVPVTGKDLRVALECVIAGDKVSTEQVPSIGCNIKWKPGNEPDYFG